MFIQTVPGVCEWCLFDCCIVLKGFSGEIFNSTWPQQTLRVLLVKTAEKVNYEWINRLFIFLLYSWNRPSHEGFHSTPITPYILMQKHGLRTVPEPKKKESKHTETQYKLKSVSFIKIFHFCQHLPASFSDRHGQHKKAFSLSISFTSHKSNPVLLCRHHILFSHVDIKPYLGHTGICAD